MKQHNIKIGDPFSFSPVTEEHVQDIILKLKCNKATGGDIHTKTLKQCDFSYTNLW